MDAGTSTPAEAFAAAKAICRRCPLKPDCLQGALERGDDYGMFGGATPKDRRKLRPHSRPQQARCPYCGEHFHPYRSTTGEKRSEPRKTCGQRICVTAHQQAFGRWANSLEVLSRAG